VGPPHRDAVDHIPAWLQVSPQLLQELRQKHVDYDWLLSIASEIGAAFREAGWPDPEGPRVLVDSQHRVETNGRTWNYFR